MSTSASKPKSVPADLDSTDQLPVLDVEAYEASLAESQKGLARTDVWAVGALQEMDELEEVVKQPRRNRAPGKTTAAELTANVERILHRIAELESEITASHEANAVLQKRGRTVEADRDQHVQRIRALEAENARLGEHRTLADTKMEGLERQMAEQVERARADLEQL